MKKVGIIMGSDSDLPILRKSMDTLKELDIPFECHIFSAHRTPAEARDFALNARANGFGALIAAAGMAAHLAGAIAATALTPMPAIVADLGTATTFTAQDKSGNILGVSIAPGVAMGLEALAGRASQLFSVAIQGPKAAIGTNTVASLQSGVVLGAAALLDGMADRMEEELNGEATLVVTGGLAPVVLPYCRRKAIHAPDLVLEGLYRYWQLNR